MIGDLGPFVGSDGPVFVVSSKELIIVKPNDPEQADFLSVEHVMPGDCRLAVDHSIKMYRGHAAWMNDVQGRAWSSESHAPSSGGCP